MKKFELSTRHTVAIVSYIAASMGYSKEEIKCIAGNMKFGSDDIGEFYEILAEPLNGIVSVKRKDEVKDLIQPFNLAERIQMVIDLILKKSNSTETIDMKPTATIYGFSPYKFSNFIRKPEEKPGLTAHEEHLADEAIRKATEETIRELKDKEVEIPNFKPAPDVASSEEIDEVNQAIESLVRLRNKLISNLNEPTKEQTDTTWDNVQKAEEEPKPFEPVKFTEEQRQRQREILGNTDGTTSRYNDAANQYVEKARKAEEERKKEREMEIQNQSKDSEDTKETIEVRFYNSTEEANLVKESIKIERTSRSSTWCDGMHIAAGSFNGHVVEIFPKEILHKLSEDLSKRTPNELFSFICGDADNLYIDNDQLTFPKLSFSANGLFPKSIAVVTTTRGDNGKGLISVKVDVDRLIKLIDISKEDIADTLKAVSNKHQIDLSKGSIVVNGTLLNSTYIRVMRKLQDERVKEVLKLIEKAVKNIFNNRKLTNWLLAGADL